MNGIVELPYDAGRIRSLKDNQLNSRFIVVFSIGFITGLT